MHTRVGVAPFTRLRLGAIGVVAALLAAAPVRADIAVYFDVTDFLAATGATPQPELPNAGLVGRHVAQITVGDLTFAINNGSPEIALILTEFNALHPGNEIALSDWEALDVLADFPVYSLGSYFIEDTDGGSCNLVCPCNDADYRVTLLLGTSVVGQFDFNAPDGELSFVGVWSDEPFDRVEYRDLTQQCDNEYWGRFFIGQDPMLCAADYNADGLGDILDFLDFIDDFATCEGLPAPCGSVADADFNGDTLVDILDFLDFIDVFAVGC